MSKQHSSHKSSQSLNTSNAVVLKDGDIYFLAAPDGSVPLGGDHALGLYYHDTRYLDGYELKVGGMKLDGLIADAAAAYQAVFELTNPALTSAHGSPIDKQRIGIKWERIIESGDLTLIDRISFHNLDNKEIEFPISVAFGAGFQDIFIIRGMQGKKTGQLRAPAWDAGVLRFKYLGVDKVYRSLSISFAPAVEPEGNNGASFQMTLKRGETKQLNISLTITESHKEEIDKQPNYEISNFEGVEHELRQRTREWTSLCPAIESDDRPFNSVIARSLRDHRVLRSKLDDDYYYAAGLPWFGALFGRDSLVAAFEMLAYTPSMAEQTLRLLAKYQSHQTVPSHDQDPGKIHHELRLGELANSGQVLQTPYYGTADATPLFLILLAHHAAWTGSLSLFQELQNNVERALGWIDHYGKIKQDEYVCYKSTAKGGLANQGWKDSGNGIVNADASYATPPIALVEVQGYVYLAKTCIADLYQRAGAHDRADSLLAEAAKLRAHFNQDFWIEELRFYALALQLDRRPAAVISSNPGQALWSGIVDPNKADLVGDRLMREDMFSGWGIRTLSTGERAYNPVGYHVGTVWPHDNTIIANGFRKYGMDAHFQRLFDGIVDAAAHFEHHRLPELFAGFSRDEYSVPVKYPEACHPQVWAAGAVPMLLQTALGLIPLGFEKRLRIVRPLLPTAVRRLQFRGLRVADARVDLSFERTHNGQVAAKVLKLDGDLEVSIEPHERELDA